MRKGIVRSLTCGSALALAVLGTATLSAQTRFDAQLQEAAVTLAEFTSDGTLPLDTVRDAYGIAIIPRVLRGGFILGGRRGRGVLAVRMPDGTWSNPAFVTLTGGSIGWQIGVESADVVLVFANEESIHRIGNGKLALGGDASAVAGHAGRRNTAAVTFKSEIYAYVKGRGLFAGASVEGAKLGIDDASNEAFYAASDARALSNQTSATPANARRLLLGLEQQGGLRSPSAPETAPAKTFPLEGAE
jgi:SH3 domain-containing YSC84-like protein 1